jgi:hypothetical protein
MCARFLGVYASLTQLSALGDDVPDVNLKWRKRLAALTKDTGAMTVACRERGGWLYTILVKLHAVDLARSVSDMFSCCVVSSYVTRPCCRAISGVVSVLQSQSGTSRIQNVRYWRVRNRLGIDRNVLTSVRISGNAVTSQLLLPASRGLGHA